MKTPKHNLIPNDWPFLERVINEIDITISEAKSEVTSAILILESEMSQVIDSLTSQASAHDVLASEVAATGTHESRILVLESEMSQVESRTLILESEMSVVQYREATYEAAYGALVHER